jgi:hypothetical protein
MSENTRQVDDIEGRQRLCEPPLGRKERQVMPKSENEQERPCLHCLMVELIDDFFAEYPPAPGGSDDVDTEEADKIIEDVEDRGGTDLRQDDIFRQYLIEQLMREIMKFDGEFRREDAPGSSVAPQVH